MYNWLLNNVGFRGADPLHGQKTVYNFWLFQNLTIDNPLLTRSLTGNSQLTHFVQCVLYTVFL